MSIDIDADREREERLNVARRLYQALKAQDPNRAITLTDGKGRVAARHYPTPEPGGSEVIWIAPWRRSRPKSS